MMWAMGVHGGRLAALILTLAALGAPAAAAPAQTSPACAPAPTSTTGATSTTATTPCPSPPADTILSNQTTFTTWAYAVSASTARRAPSTSSPGLATLHLSTEDGFPEVYIVLRERQVGSRTWAEVTLPIKPAGRTGWVPREALDSYERITTQLVLNRTTERLRLYRAGRLIFQAPAGVGAPSSPTPAGRFYIREQFPVKGVSAYGPYAYGTSAYANLTDWPGGGVVGLHGTDEPGLVPGRPSHGCIRLHNADILRLSLLVDVGTPLLIQ
jgi:lipoprotein-anchoring transpeptidase ErfK/SrfK